MDSLLWFIIGIGATLAFFGFNEWRNEKNLALKWWEWIVLIAWFLFWGFTIAFTTTSIAEHEERAGWLGALVLGGIAIAWAVAGWFYILRNKLTAKT